MVGLGFLSRTIILYESSGADGMTGVEDCKNKTKNSYLINKNYKSNLTSLIVRCYLYLHKKFFTEVTQRFEISKHQEKEMKRIHLIYVVIE